MQATRTEPLRVISMSLGLSLVRNVTAFLADMNKKASRVYGFWVNYGFDQGFAEDLVLKIMTS